MSKKIGFYFEEQLPDITNPLSDDFSFYYVKNEKNINGELVNIPNLFLYNKTENDFFRLSIPDNLYVNSVNGISTNNIDINLQSVIDKGNSTNKPIIFTNGNSLYSKNSFTYFSNLSSTQLLNIDTIDNTIIFGNNFGNENISFNSNNNIFFGNNISLINSTYSNNVIIGNDIVPYVNPIYEINNNLFIGGTAYDENTEEFINNQKIQDNIYIKNLGYGNTNTNFKFVTPIKLSDNTENINDINDIDPDTESILIEKNNLGVRKLLLSEFGLNTITKFNNISDKNIKLNQLNVGNIGTTYKNIILSESNFSTLNFSDHSKSIYIGTPESGNIQTNYVNTINIGNNSLLKAEKTINIGNDNLKYVNDSNIIGSGNQSQYDVEDNFFSNNIFGNINLFNYDGYITNTLILGNNNYYETTFSENNITLGSYSNQFSSNNNTIVIGNFGNNYNKASGNIIIGNNKGVTNYRETHNNILIGNGAENYLTTDDNNLLIIHNQHDIDEPITHEPLIKASFDWTNPYFRINGQLQIDPTKLDNADIDVTHTKLLTINSDGEIGTLSKNNKNYSYNEQKTGGTWTNNKPIYRKGYLITTDGTTENIIDLTTFNIEKIIDKKGYINDGSGDFYKVGENSTFVFVKTSLTDVKVINKKNNILDAGIIIELILEYTKTTD